MFTFAPVGKETIHSSVFYDLSKEEKTLRNWLCWSEEKCKICHHFLWCCI